ncbi:MAG TPA: hypothetical protein VGN74_05610 [Brevundimonas sp.]|jgi:hypothetical protein|uniref:hypothetical protein n=1 Tax=Brevundimonas sp. TaxID=1871086 RepID=UPI002E1089A3|nr:hypothetical protein [Brevundimonas sp.]
MPIQYPYDASLLLHDGAAAVTSSAAGVVASAARIFDTESTASPVGRFPVAVVINVSALDLASTDETYDFIFEGSNSATFASGNQQLGSIAVGATGRYTILADNEQGGTVYRYFRIRAVLAGTTPSVTYVAFMAPAVVA